MSEQDRIRWDERYRRGGPRAAPHPWLAATCGDAHPPEGPRHALDLACGSGRHSLWLLERGWEVTAVDISPVALAQLRATADAAGLGARLHTVALDLDTPTLPPGPFDRALVFFFLDRRLLGADGPIARVLAPGGRLVLCHPTEGNLERHARPSARFLLCQGELAVLVRDWQVHRLEEGWDETGRHTARLAAARLPAA